MIAKLCIPILFGVSGYLLWMSWLWFPLAVCLQGVAFYLGVIDIWRETKQLWITHHWIIPCGFGILFALYIIPVFLPETGFDALWYHLPITEVYVHTHQTQYIPELYQSAMPRLGSYVFVPAYVLGGVMGVKLFVYGIVLICISWVYTLSRYWFHAPYAGFFALCVASFHFFGWQSGSAYVDQLRFLFEIGVLWVLIKRMYSPIVLTVAGVLFGFALATKLITLFFFPILIVYALLLGGWKRVIFICGTAFLVVFPWYVQSFQWTGNPFSPLFQSLDGKEQLALAGFSNTWQWLVMQTVKLPAFLVLLATNLESYTTPLFVLAYATVVRKKYVWSPLFIYVVLCCLFLLWIPPFSLRYALSAVVILFFLLMRQYIDAYIQSRIALVVCVWIGTLGILFQIGVRTMLVVRVMPFFLGKISQEEYLSRHITPLSNGPFRLWYGGYWKSYLYSK